MDCRRFSVIAALITVLALGVYVSLVFAGSMWLTIGSDGTPDDLNQAKVVYSGTSAELKTDFIGSVILRYNVSETDLDDQNVNFKVRYQDNGAGARVVVTLKAHNLLTGVVTNVISFDSNSKSQSEGYQVGLSPPTCTLTSSNPLNFAENAYYFEVKLVRSQLGGKPGVSQIRLIAVDC